MDMRDFLCQVKDEISALRWYCVIHGPEFWLAIAALCLVAACGLGVICVIRTISNRKVCERSEPVAPALDRPSELLFRNAHDSDAGSQP